MHHRPSFMSGSGFAGRHQRAWRLRHSRQINAFPCPQGACGTTGRFTAPAAPARVCMRASRMPSVAHEQWPSPTPKIVELNRASEADPRLRSAREWTLRLAACPRGCHWRRRAPVRASCRPDMHLDRPPVVPASVPLCRADQRSRKRLQGSGIVAAIRIPLRVSKTIATRPSPERDGDTIIVLGDKSRTNAEHFNERCEQNGG